MGGLDFSQALSNIRSSAVGALASSGGLGHAPGAGGHIEITPPDDLLAQIDNLRKYGKHLAQMILAEACKESIAALEAHNGPTQYGVRDAIAALEVGLSGGIDIVDDPALGLFVVGAGRIDSDSSVGSSPAGSIKQFLMELRDGGNAASHRLYRHRTATRTPGVRSHKVGRVRPPTKRQAAKERFERYEKNYVERNTIGGQIRTELAKGAGADKETIATLRAKLTILSIPLPQEAIAGIQTSTDYARAVAREVEARGAQTIAFPRTRNEGRYGGSVAAQVDNETKKALSIFKHVATSRDLSTISAHRRAALAGTGPAGREKTSAETRSRLGHLFRTISTDEIHRLTPLLLRSEQEYAPGSNRRVYAPPRAKAGHVPPRQRRPEVRESRSAIGSAAPIIRGQAEIQIVYGTTVTFASRPYIKTPHEFLQMRGKVLDYFKGNDEMMTMVRKGGRSMLPKNVSIIKGLIDQQRTLSAEYGIGSKEYTLGMNRRLTMAEKSAINESMRLQYGFALDEHTTE